MRRPLMHFLELLADGLGAARDDEALVHQLLPGEILENLLPRHA